MEIRAVTQETGVPWELQHSEILAFVRKYGAGRVSPAVLRALLRLTPSDLDRPGCSLLVARIRRGRGTVGRRFLRRGLRPHPLRGRRASAVPRPRDRGEAAPSPADPGKAAKLPGCAQSGPEPAPVLSRGVVRLGPDPGPERTNAAPVGDTARLPGACRIGRL